MAQAYTEDLRLNVPKKRKLSLRDALVLSGECCQEGEHIRSGCKLQEGAASGDSVSPTTHGPPHSSEMSSFCVTSWVGTAAEYLRGSWPVMTLGAVPETICTTLLRRPKKTRRSK